MSISDTVPIKPLASPIRLLALLDRPGAQLHGIPAGDPVSELANAYVLGADGQKRAVTPECAGACLDRLDHVGDDSRYFTTWSVYELADDGEGDDDGLGDGAHKSEPAAQSDPSEPAPPAPEGPPVHEGAQNAPRVTATRDAPDRGPCVLPTLGAEVNASEMARALGFSTFGKDGAVGRIRQAATTRYVDPSSPRRGLLVAVDAALVAACEAEGFAVSHAEPGAETEVEPEPAAEGGGAEAGPAATTSGPPSDVDRVWRRPGRVGPERGTPAREGAPLPVPVGLSVFEGAVEVRWRTGSDAAALDLVAALRDLTQPQ